MCCTMTIGGMSAGRRVSSASIAWVPPVDAPIRMSPLPFASVAGGGDRARRGRIGAKRSARPGAQRADTALDRIRDLADRVRARRAWR